MYGQNSGIIVQIKSVRDFLIRSKKLVLIFVLLLSLIILIIDMFVTNDGYIYAAYIIPVLLISLYANVKWSLSASLCAATLTLIVPVLTASHGIDTFFQMQCRSAASLFFILMSLGASIILGFIREIIRYETLISTIINNIPYGVLFCNSRGKVVHMNPSVTALAGYETSDLQDKDQEYIETKLFHPDRDGSDSSSNLAEKLNHYNLVRKNGTVIPIALSKNEISRSRHLDGTIYVFRDTTKERELESSRDDMLSILYHDLRTPLSVISSYAGLMQEKDFDNADLPKMSGSIEMLCQTSIGMLENLLEDARQKSGSVKFFPAKYDLEEIVNSINKMYFNYAAGKEITVKTDIEKGLYIFGDLIKIRQIIFNLMSNSMKFVGVNGIITIKAVKSGDFAEISFTDNGPGIPSDFIPNIFHRFTKGDGKKKGSGLGLYITKKLVEMQGGTIQVRSGLNQGTTFEFRLPAA